MKKKKQAHPRRAKNQHKKLKHMSTDTNKRESESFLDELIGWFSDHQQQIDQLFSRGGSVNLKDFELGLMRLGVPCQQFQLHTLTQQLKTFNDMISYQDMIKQIQPLSSHSADGDFTKRQESVETENVSSLKHQHQQRLQNTAKHRFIRLSVRVIPFTSATAHPGNFEVVLSSSRTVFGLMSVIEDRAGIQTSSLEVFSSSLPTKVAHLPLESTLEDCGFKGGPEESPPEATVYYDYRLSFTDCPILNYDHYIRSKQDSTVDRCL